MTSWLWLLGWFLAVSAFIPALMLATIAGHWLALMAWDAAARLWGRRQAESDVAAEVEDYLRSLP